MTTSYEEIMRLAGPIDPPKRRRVRTQIPLESILSPPSFQDPSVSIYTPKTFEEYIGQPHAKTVVQIMMEAADIEDRPIPNILITGTAGLGKTSLGKIIYTGKDFRFTDGNSLNSSWQNLSGYVIIDEIHNAKSDVCDSLNIMIDNGTVRIIGCTTNPGLLPAPFRTRFRTVNLLPYEIVDLVTIMQNVLERRSNDLTISEELLTLIAERGRRTPRVTLQYLAFIIDMMIVRKIPELTEELLYETFDVIGVDEQGLIDIDRRYLDAFPDDGRPVGIQYLQAVLSCDKETIEQEIEPYLMSLKLIDRTQRGRIRIDISDDEEDFLERLFD